MGQLKRNATASLASDDFDRVDRETDFHQWLLNQAAAIRHYRFEAIDWEGVAEELEGMAKSLAHALTSQFQRLLKHLLKWQYQPERRGPSWQLSIQNARSEIRDALEDSPSLQQQHATLIARAYGR